jgi:hypothetical protein
MTSSTQELLLVTDGKCTVSWKGPDGREHLAEVRALRLTESGICVECC